MLVKLVVSLTILTCVVAKSADFIRDLDDSTNNMNDALKNLETDLENVDKNVDKKKVFGRAMLSQKDLLKGILKTLKEIRDHLATPYPTGRPISTRRLTSTRRTQHNTVGSITDGPPRERSGGPSGAHRIPPYTEGTFTDGPPRERSGGPYGMRTIPPNTEGGITVPVKRGMHYRSDLGETIQNIKNIVKDLRMKVRVL